MRLGRDDERELRGRMLGLQRAAAAVGPREHAFVAGAAVGRQRPEHVRRVRAEQRGRRQALDLGRNLRVAALVFDFRRAFAGRDDGCGAKDQIRFAPLLIVEERDLAQDVRACDGPRALETLRRCDCRQGAEHTDCDYRGRARRKCNHCAIPFTQSVLRIMQASRSPKLWRRSRFGPGSASPGPVLRGCAT